jgi:hypothetical protein
MDINTYLVPCPFDQFVAILPRRDVSSYMGCLFQEFLAQGRFDQGRYHSWLLVRLWLLSFSSGKCLKTLAYVSSYIINYRNFFFGFFFFSCRRRIDEGIYGLNCTD